MSDKVRRLCKWDKEKIEKDYKTLSKIVNPPKYICKKCGRVANAEEWLHKPAPLYKE